MGATPDMPMRSTTRSMKSIVLPAKSDHKIMRWAIQGSLFELLLRGVRIWWSPPPFDHSKLLIIDDRYFSLGSSNWDPRSLRLNFEVNIEVVDLKQAKHLKNIFEKKRRLATPYTLADLNSRNLHEKIRDGFCRLFSPYL